MAVATRPLISIVIPVHNEEAVLDLLIERLEQALSQADVSWTVLFVDDGSTDGSLAKIKAINLADRRFAAISLSRNFGKDVAIAAGLRHAVGDAVVLMDADLQHPPEVIPAFIGRWREGFKLVYGARQSRDADSLLRRFFSRSFHAIFRRVAGTRLPAGVVDFLLLDRVAVDAMNRLGERTRFSKGLYAWIGFAAAAVPFSSAERAAGTSRWSFLQLLRFAVDGLVSFSSFPLKVWSYVGALISLGAMIYGGYFLVKTMLSTTDVPGFPSLIVSIMFFAGVQLISLGVIGEYLARIYEEAKGRPLYLVAEEVGLERRQADAAPANPVVALSKGPFARAL